MPGCLPGTSDDRQLQILIRSVESANEFIRNENSDVIHQLKEKSFDVQTVTKANIWAPKGQKVYELSFSLIGYIDGIKNELKTAYAKENRNDKGTAQRILVRDGKAHELYLKLVAYRNELNGMLMPEEFADNPVFQAHLVEEKATLQKIMPVLKDYTNTGNPAAEAMNEKSWMQDNFLNSTPLMCHSILNTIEFDVLTSAKYMLDYCNSSIAYNFCGFYATQPFSAINTNYLKAGDSIEISAGIHHYHSDPKMQITIDGKRVIVNKGSYVLYGFRPVGKPGKYTVPISIAYPKPDGTKAIVQNTVSYTIVPD